MCLRALRFYPYHDMESYIRLPFLDVHAVYLNARGIRTLDLRSARSPWIWGSHPRSTLPPYSSGWWGHRRRRAAIPQRPGLAAELAVSADLVLRTPPDHHRDSESPARMHSLLADQSGRRPKGRRGSRRLSRFRARVIVSQDSWSHFGRGSLSRDSAQGVTVRHSPLPGHRRRDTVP